MKALYLALACILLSMIYSRICDGDAENVKDCQAATFDNTTFYRCCFIDSKAKKDGKEINTKVCSEIKKDEYDNIKKKIEDLEKQMKDIGYESPKVSINCESNYIFLSIISLALFLL